MQYWKNVIWFMSKLRAEISNRNSQKVIQKYKNQGKND